MKLSSDRHTVLVLVNLYLICVLLQHTAPGMSIMAVGDGELRHHYVGPR